MTFYSIVTLSTIAASTAVCAIAAMPAIAAARDLDIGSYRETFSETFRGPLDVTPWGPSKWIAHTPWNGDFGDARFADPTSGFPFSTGSGGLTITARKNDAGIWESGLLSSTDANGNGFAQSRGYFEARMKMPPGPGVWPAFWLLADHDPNYKAEIDIVEYYGQLADRYEVNLHLWPKSAGRKPQGQGAAITVPPDSLASAFHTYGVEILRSEIVFYFDRHEVQRMPAAPAMGQPMTLLINLALGSGWPIDKTPNPSVLQVDYVKAFSRR
jgi:beta-glucanase (GH16 family)